ncbi:MAG: cation:proton antiporter, partial [Actinobacteria bacterium]|nr:cation:proton antiporter [Actinomycetota bacterium]
NLAPSVHEWIFPNAIDSRSMLLAVSTLGVALLLVVTGYETDLGLIRALGRPALVVAAGSILVPFAAGVAPGLLLPSRFVGLQADRGVFVLFIAAALTTSSLAVVAKILSELGLLRRNFGQITLAAGMANEIVGYVLLGVIASIAASGRLSPGDAAVTFAGIVAFVVAGITIGQRLVDWGFRRLRAASAEQASWLAFAMVLTFAAGAATQALGAEAVLGAFVVGVVMGRSRYREPATREQLESITSAFLAPLFFATAGLQVDIAVLADPTVLLWGAVLLSVAWGAKFGGVAIASLAVGLHGREAAALGFGLNARGVLEVLIATVGLSLGVFNQTSYSLILLTAIVSAMLAPPLVRAVAAGWAGSPSERDRLAREERLAANHLVRIDRVLIPTRGGSDSRLAALIVHQAWPLEAAVTLLSVSDGSPPPDLDALCASMTGREADHHVVRGDDVAAAIASQALLGYGAIAVGATRIGSSSRLLSPVIDEVLSRTSLPLVIVRRGVNAPENPLDRFERALIPVSGTRASAAAQELGLALALHHGCPTVMIHVVARPESAPTGGFRRLGAVANRLPHVQRTLVAQRVVDDSLGAARRAGLDATALVRDAVFPAEEIVATAGDLGADLIVVGARLRRIEGRAFIGHNVEHILEHSGATVVIVAHPPPPRAS